MAKKKPKYGTITILPDHHRRVHLLCEGPITTTNYKVIECFSRKSGAEKEAKRRRWRNCFIVSPILNTSK